MHLGSRQRPVHPTWICAFAAAMACLCVPVAAAEARGGDLDRSFGGDGRVTTRLSEQYTVLNAVATLSDGRLLLAGEEDQPELAPSLHHFLRYGHDGALDSSFGSARGAFLERSIADLLPDADGSIVTVGGGPSLQVRRYNRDGSLDRTFGTEEGATSTLLGAPAAGRNLTRLGDGRVVASDSFEAEDGPERRQRLFVAVARYLPDGRPDPSFAGDGRILTRVGFTQAGEGGHVVQPDGKIVVAVGKGTTGPDSPVEVILLRYQADGTIDRGFGRRGRVRVVRAVSDGDDEPVSAAGVALTPGRRILVAGRTARETLEGYREVPFVARYLPDGSLDRSFGQGGFAPRLAARGLYSVDAMTLAPSGHIFYAGPVFGRTRREGDDFGVGRLTRAGQPDPAFGQKGVVRTRFGPRGQYERVQDLELQPDGRLVAAGDIRYPDRGAFLLARYFSGLPARR